MAEAFINDKNRNKQEVESMEVAEAAREKDWEHPSFIAELFMGNLRLDAVYPYPRQDPEDRKIGDTYLAGLKLYLDAHLHGDEIDRDGQIPDSVMKSLAEQKAFGLKIPKAYGGMGFSQTNYIRSLELIARYCGSTGAMLSAHQSIGVPQPLILFGTEEQKRKYLPRFAAGEVSAFALTEPEVGSDPAQLSTTATPIENGDFYLVNGTKLWCTNGAIADILVVMAQTPAVAVRGKERKQITAFILEKNMPGFEVVHRCRFMGLHGIQNAVLKFTNVRVPKENIIWGLGKGLKLALVTLNAGRLSLGATCIASAREALKVSREWGGTRKQWGAAIGEHEAGAAKLASLSADLLAMEAVTYLACDWVDKKSQDIRLEAAMTKLFTSLRWEHQVHEVLQLRGGRGYETALSLKARGEMPAPVERWARDARINQIVEGTNEILCLFISREALDRHLTIAGDVLNSRLSVVARLGAAVKASLFYATWYPKQWLGLLWIPRFEAFGPLARHMRFVKRAGHRLALATFHQMLRHGPQLEKRQLQLRRLVEIATDLFAMAATLSRARGQMPQHALLENIELSADLFCAQARRRIQANFCALRCNHDKLSRKLGAKVLSSQVLWQE